MKHFEILGGKAMIVELDDRPLLSQIRMGYLVTKHHNMKNWIPTKVIENPILLQKAMAKHDQSKDYKDTYFKLPPGTWQIAGLLTDVTEVEAAKFVEYTGWGGGPDYWQDYTNPKGDVGTAVESLESAILAEGYYLDVNPIPVPDYSEGHVRFDETVEHAKAQSRVLCRERTLILRREGI